MIGPLLELGADPLALDSQGKSALWLALDVGARESATALLLVSDPGLTRDGTTLLMKACEEKLPWAVRMLANQDSADKRDNDGHKAIYQVLLGRVRVS